MKRLTLVILALVLSGCFYNGRTVPRDVSVLPNDCANQHNIERWLTAQLDQPKGMLEQRDYYNEQNKLLKRKIWDLRYSCNR
jgi:hypothetical protein